MVGRRVDCLSGQCTRGAGCFTRKRQEDVAQNRDVSERSKYPGQSWR
jgi:hypothetical protein